MHGRTYVHTTLVYSIYRAASQTNISLLVNKLCPGQLLKSIKKLLPMPFSPADLTAYS